MTLRERTHYTCPNGHRGTWSTMENDQAYSKPYFHESFSGMEWVEVGAGKSELRCLQCGRQMSEDTAST
jgi:hypothetical protein